jgi:hypothetical protein
VFDLPSGFQLSPIYTLASDVPFDIQAQFPNGTTRIPVIQRNAGGRQFRKGVGERESEGAGERERESGGKVLSIFPRSLAPRSLFAFRRYPSRSRILAPSAERVSASSIAYSKTVFR